MITNELIDETAEKLAIAVAQQNNLPLIGSVHLFMLETPSQGISLVIDYVPEEYKTGKNLLNLAKAFMDWCEKNCEEDDEE